MDTKDFTLAWIFDDRFSFGIDGPKLVLNIPFSNLDKAITLFMEEYELSFSESEFVKLDGIVSVCVRNSEENKIVIKNKDVLVTFNTEGKIRFLEELNTLRQQGSLSFLDLDDEGISDEWVEFIISTDDALYNQLGNENRNNKPTKHVT